MSQPNPGQLNWIANFIWTFSNRALPTSLRRRSQNQFCFLCGAELAQANGAFPRGPIAEALAGVVFGGVLLEQRAEHGSN